MITYLHVDQLLWPIYGARRFRYHNNPLIVFVKVSRIGCFFAFPAEIEILNKLVIHDYKMIFLVYFGKYKLTNQINLSEIQPN